MAWNVGNERNEGLTILFIVKKERKNMDMKKVKITHIPDRAG